MEASKDHTITLTVKQSAEKELDISNATWLSIFGDAGTLSRMNKCAAVKDWEWDPNVVATENIFNLVKAAGIMELEKELINQQDVISDCWSIQHKMKNLRNELESRLL